jgi:hypothetical protein
MLLLLLMMMMMVMVMVMVMVMLMMTMMMVVLLMMCSDGVVTRCLSVVTGIRYTYCHDLLFAFIIALTHMALIIVFFFLNANPPEIIFSLW